MGIGNSKQFLPNSEDELNRRRHAHDMIRKLAHGNFNCPVEEALQRGIRVLDAGCFGGGSFILTYTRSDWPIAIAELIRVTKPARGSYIWSLVVDVQDRVVITHIAPFACMDVMLIIKIEGGYLLFWRQTLSISVDCHNLYPSRYTLAIRIWNRYIDMNSLFRLVNVFINLLPGGWVELLEFDAKVQQSGPTYDLIRDSCTQASKTLDICFRLNMPFTHTHHLVRPSPKLQ
ncbi:hypothetical protein BC936DRAFT_146175 [Jimgerdemannia flammicorona]|uniref:Methyltransferase domain-containing protein n=1 Tax=Jimgerdemannia flammicorona TaxID=994334 RepID=A0A433D8X8_9FUNG|nr:hypothetical protein BC936DRAFT_146175 [Jimgerdemannia flammicorona]